MVRRIVLAAILAGMTSGLFLVGRAMGDSFSVGLRTDSLSLGINIGAPPQLVVVPGTPVYQAPGVPHNYFFYGGRYYLFHEGAWFLASHYNGPWTVIAVERVPRQILLVPVEHYKIPPGHWKKGGPPPWAGHGRENKHKKKWKNE